MCGRPAHDVGLIAVQRYAQLAALRLPAVGMVVGADIGAPKAPLLPHDVRFLPVSQYLLGLASGVWELECGVSTSREE